MKGRADSLAFSRFIDGLCSVHFLILTRLQVKSRLHPHNCELCTVHRQRPVHARIELRLPLQSEPPSSPSRLSLNPAACSPCLTLLPAVQSRRVCLGRRPVPRSSHNFTQVGIHLRASTVEACRCPFFLYPHPLLPSSSPRSLASSRHSESSLLRS